MYVFCKHICNKRKSAISPSTNGSLLLLQLYTRVVTGTHKSCVQRLFIQRNVNPQFGFQKLSTQLGLAVIGILCETAKIQAPRHRTPVSLFTNPKLPTLSLSEERTLQFWFHKHSARSFHKLGHGVIGSMNLVCHRQDTVSLFGGACTMIDVSSL